MVGIHDFNRVIHLDVTSGNRASARLAQRQNGLFAFVHAQRYALEVEQDFDDVLLQSFNGRVFMQHTVHFNLNDGTTRNGRQQNTPERITQRVAKTALKRLQRDFCPVRVDFVNA